MESALQATQAPHKKLSRKLPLSISYFFSFNNSIDDQDVVSVMEPTVQGDILVVSANHQMMAQMLRSIGTVIKVTNCFVAYAKGYYFLVCDIV